MLLNKTPRLMELGRSLVVVSVQAMGEGCVNTESDVGICFGTLVMVTTLRYGVRTISGRGEWLMANQQNRGLALGEAFRTDSN